MFDRVLVPLENAAAIVSGVCTALAMVLTTADALMRYLFDAPLVFQFYFTANYLLVGIILMALPWGFRTGGYIRVGILTEIIPDGPRFLLFRLGLLLSAGYLLLLAWKGGQYFLKTFLTGQVYIEDLNWPVYLSWIWIPLGMGLLTLRVLMVALGPSDFLHIEHDPEEDV
ncbi:TRAP transporter small permease [Antarctobacter sp.]|uniref:TRAP transporter small permease n=1 Tax=Antarctobacter sp. TaxID=1872577 RepID=UPI003A95C423